MTAMITVFRITGFHNCDGCTRKVRNALRRFHGLRLLNLDRESGNVTVLTSEHPEVIRYALHSQMKKPVVIVPINQNPNSAASSMAPAPHTFDLPGFGEAVLGMYQILNGVEIISTNAVRVNFIHRDLNQPVVMGDTDGKNSRYGGVHIEEVDVGHAPRRPTTRAPPWPVAEPSAPLITTEEEEVYGYPPEYYGFSATGSHDRRDGYCSIM